MLLPSEILILVQVYICLVVNASSVFVNYLDGGGDNRNDDNLLFGAPTRSVRPALSSISPRLRSNNKFSLFSRGHDGNSHKNHVILDPPGHMSSPPQSATSEHENSNVANAIDLDFESYSVTISPSLMLDANDNDQDELEEKIEMHTNNHHHHPSNTRHYGSYQPAKHYLTGPTVVGSGKYPHSSNSVGGGFSNSHNLNYIHSLLLTKPANQVTNSLTGLLHGLSSTATSSSLSHYLPATSAPSAPVPSQQQQQVQRYSQFETQLQNATLLDLSSGGSLAATTCGRQQVAGGSREPRIVGGNSTYEGEFPWAVSIQRHGNHHCGGVIVARRWILTAAHCVRSQLVGNLVVRTGGSTLARSPNHLGSHLERDYVVDQVVMHGDFSRYDNLTASQMKSSANTNNADIALLRLKQEIHWNELAWPVCFPPKEAGNFSGHDAVVIGWGKLNEKSEEFSNELQKVKLSIIDNKVCQNWFRQAGREMPIDDRVICAGFKNGGKDACHGDSGGPLLSKINGHYAVVGVVSTGIGCARPLLPGLYSRVSSYINWIERHIAP